MGSAGAQITETKLTAADAGAFDNLGQSVSLDGDTAVAGAPSDDSPGTDAGSAYVFVRTGTTWTQQARLTAGDGAAFDSFGVSVSISGDTILVGSTGDDDAGPASGSAYVFVRSGSTWIQEAKLTASDAAPSDGFGTSVSVDGDTAVVGAPFDGDGGVGSGSAYVFVRTGTTWNQQAKLTAGDAAAFDNFGVAVSLDGDTALVGAWLDDHLSINAGSAYVFVRSGATWAQEAKLTADDPARTDTFGQAVSIQGNTAVVGVRRDDDRGRDSGSAFIFTRSASTWTQEAKLIARDAAAGDSFGHSVSIDGNAVVVGAAFDDVFNIFLRINAGSAYVFVRESTWTESAKLTPNDPASLDAFGLSVATDGSTVLVGAPGDDEASLNAGAAYVYTLGAGDVTPPTIVPPDDLTVECNTAGGASGVELGTPTVSDDADSPEAIVVTNDAPDTFPLGVTSVLWAATDTSGNSASATQQVTVVDTSPPVVVPPGDVAVVADSAAGAIVDIGVPTTTDVCDPNPVITHAAPPVFPAGTTTVIWTATDESGNAGTATQLVTVLTPRDLKERAIATLEALQAAISGAPGVGDPEEAVEELEEAIEDLEESLDPELWAHTASGAIDPFHLDREEGDDVFDEEADAVEAIFEAIDDGEIVDPVLVGALLGVVADLVTADRLLAKVAIDQAEAHPEADKDEIDEAHEHLAEGDALVARAEGASLEQMEDLIDEAIEDAFRDAWKAAQKALRTPWDD